MQIFFTKIGLHQCIQQLEHIFYNFVVNYSSNAFYFLQLDYDQRFFKLSRLDMDTPKPLKF